MAQVMKQTPRAEKHAKTQDFRHHGMVIGKKIEKK
jgi:hypothetical protein